MTAIRHNTITVGGHIASDQLEPQPNDPTNMLDEQLTEMVRATAASQVLRGQLVTAQHTYAFIQDEV